MKSSEWLKTNTGVKKLNWTKRTREWQTNILTSTSKNKYINSKGGGKMFNKKLSNFFSIEDKNFRRNRKERLKDQIQIEEYRSEIM